MFTLFIAVVIALQLHQVRSYAFVGNCNWQLRPQSIHHSRISIVNAKNYEMNNSLRKIRPSEASSLQLASDPVIATNFSSTYITRTIVSSATILAILTSFNEIAYAKDGQYGLLEGKWAGMLHPVYFLMLFLVSVSAAYHGLRWRRARELTAEISRIKSNEFSPQIFEMRAERDRILQSDPKNKHISLGSIILGSGTAMALEGGLSTYFRAGELFPDYHLFGGLGLVCIWASSYALAPFMARGKDWARNLHVTLNAIGILLFASQILSGWEIMVNVYNEVPGW